MNEVKPCGVKDHAQLSAEWDQLAQERHRQIVSGEDISYEHVILPTMFNLLAGTDMTCVIDIGAGTGNFANHLTRIATNVIAIEPSASSIAVARAFCRDIPNVRFIQSPVEEVGNTLDRQATVAVSVMTLMTAPNLQAFARAVSSLLLPGARFAATLSHPCFWPVYWGYDSQEWFDYSKEIFIEGPFVISRHRTNIITTHIHRPLEHYLQTFAECGFNLDAFVEPIPSPAIQARYPQKWHFPRFLGLRWTKTN
jgi:SAM-dependent methyltransferase